MPSALLVVPSKPQTCFYAPAFSFGQSRKKRDNNKWRHQDEALAIFLKEERGILNMATGTGKTRTALKILSRLFETGEIETAIPRNGNVDDARFDPMTMLARVGT